MHNLTYAIGAILTVVGVIAYVGTGAVSITALIPTFVGLLLLICALLAHKTRLRRHAIHAALVLALLGAAGSLMNVAKLGDLLAGTAERPAAIVVSTIMFLLLLLFIAAGVRSFVAARRDPASSAR